MIDRIVTYVDPITTASIHSCFMDVAEMVEALTKALDRMIGDHVHRPAHPDRRPGAHRCADSLFDRRLAQV